MEFEYEQSVMDELLDEFKLRMLDIATSGIKQELENLTETNKYLSKELLNAREKNMELEKKTIRHNMTTEEIKREVEREFYTTKITDVLVKFLENAEVWVAQKEYKMPPKCDDCDNERQIFATFPDGSVAKKLCSCASPNIAVYTPQKIMLHRIRFNKSTGVLDKRFGLSVRYIQGTEHSESYGSYVDFCAIKVYDAFTPDVGEEVEKVAFRSENECRKYCDYINASK